MIYISQFYRHPDTVETTNVQSSSLMRLCPNDAQPTQQNESSVANDVHWVTPKPHACKRTCTPSSAFYFCACRLSGRQKQWKKKEKKKPAASRGKPSRGQCKAAQMSLPNGHPAIAHGNVSHSVHICFKLQTSLAFLYNHPFLKFKPTINLLRHILSLCGTVKTKLNVFPLTTAFCKALRTLKSSNYCRYCRFIVSEGKANTQCPFWCDAEPTLVKCVSIYTRNKRAFL